MIGAPPAGGGIQIPGRAEANGLAALVDLKTVESPQLQSFMVVAHPCHGAVADSLGPIAIEIPQLQYIDQVFDVLVSQVQQIRALSWETVEIPQLQLVSSGHVVARPVVCKRQVPMVDNFAVHRQL